MARLEIWSRRAIQRNRDRSLHAALHAQSEEEIIKTPNAYTVAGSIKITAAVQTRVTRAVCHLKGEAGYAQASVCSRLPHV